MLRRISSSTSPSAIVALNRGNFTKTNVISASSPSCIFSCRFQTARQLVRGGGTSEYWVKTPKTRKRIYTILLILFAYFQFFAPKRMDYMKKRFDHELNYYSDHDKKYGYQRNYAIGSEGNATVIQNSPETARPADATGAVTEPDGIASTSRLYRPKTWFGWYAKD